MCPPVHAGAVRGGAPGGDPYGGASGGQGAWLAAGLAAELAGPGQPRVYLVEPTGPFEDDPNVTDKRFPGNPTRSYRSAEPLRVVAEVTDWPRLEPAELRAWRDRLTVLLADGGGEILD